MDTARERPRARADAVELDMVSGETLVVMGRGGCGRSTLLHLLDGLERPSAGEVWLAGRRIDQLSEKAMGLCEVGLLS